MEDKWIGWSELADQLNTLPLPIPILYDIEFNTSQVTITDNTESEPNSDMGTLHQAI